MSGIRKAPPISISSPRDTTTSRPRASDSSASRTAAALLLTTSEASAPDSRQSRRVHVLVARAARASRGRRARGSSSGRRRRRAARAPPGRGAPGPRFVCSTTPVALITRSSCQAPAAASAGADPRQAARARRAGARRARPRDAAASTARRRSASTARTAATTRARGAAGRAVERPHHLVDRREARSRACGAPRARRPSRRPASRRPAAARARRTRGRPSQGLRSARTVSSRFASQRPVEAHGDRRPGLGRPAAPRVRVRAHPRVHLDRRLRGGDGLHEDGERDLGVALDALVPEAAAVRVEADGRRHRLGGDHARVARDGPDLHVLARERPDERAPHRLVRRLDLLGVRARQDRRDVGAAAAGEGHEPQRPEERRRCRRVALMPSAGVVVDAAVGLDEAHDAALVQRRPACRSASTPSARCTDRAPGTAPGPRGPRSARRSSRSPACTWSAHWGW